MSGVESIKDSFPHPTIAKFPGRPNYDAIAEVHSKLKQNASAIHSNLGGGMHGLLGIALQPGTYTVLTGHHFIPPVNPGPTANIPNGLTGLQISERVREHTELLRLWKQYHQVELALKQQLIASFDPMYLKAISSRHIGYAGISLIQMLQHLYDHYGDLSPAELEENDERMKTPYDTTLPIETLYEQMEQAVEIAEAGRSPYTNSQVLTRAYNLIFQTGMFTDACREWRNKPTADKTWENFKTHFALAYKDLKQNQQAASSTGMHAANAILENMQQDTKAAIAELTNATLMDRDNVNALINANKAMKNDVETLQRTITSLQMQLTSMMNNQQNVNRNPRRNRNNNCNAYCWTHGKTRNPLHTSKTCRNRAEGHKEEATLDNKMGGSERFCSPTTNT